MIVKEIIAVGLIVVFIFLIALNVKLRIDTSYCRGLVHNSQVEIMIKNNNCYKLDNESKDYKLVGNISNE
ncbi:hypothetical protein CMI47_13085 [Candidatus Pacearchaeota archaeon]|nr:hypothetical protein [Candidatus Pacearchaeota archaeon]|tara:strand:+ start:22274 stop:22483 length:210 start_codon:yes stop_codon:yes gene_type:complete